MTSLVATMNNNGPPHDQRPFGYTFNFSEPFSDPADIPVNGPPLLNNHENTFLGDFFGNPAGFQFDFGFNLPLQQHGGHHTQQEDLNWLINEPAPTLLQATAAPPKAASPATNNFQPFSAPPGFDFHGFADGGAIAAGNGHSEVLAAASMLDSHSAQQPQQQHLHIAPQVVSAPPMSQPVETTRGPRAGPPPTPATLSGPTYEGPHSATTSPNELVFPHSFPFEAPHNAPSRHAMAQPAEDLSDARLYRFGSDSHFTREGFQALHENETKNHIEKTLLQDLYILHPMQASGDNTTRPSPEAAAGSRKRARDDEQLEFDRKRRRGQDLEGEDTKLHVRRPSAPVPRTSSSNPTATAAKPRRISSMETGSAKRRRSSTSGAKPPRENLSEEQKRNNHIMSEQKRRNLIKSGFEELHSIVPELRQGGLSKSNVLVETANFLDRVIQTNKELLRAMGLPT